MNLYEWPDGKRCAVTLSFDFDAETPYLWRTRADRPAVLGELELRRFGARQGVYRILDLLDKWSIRATFFVPGWIAERYPEVVGEVARRGHEIGMHGYLHERVDQLTEGEVEETVARGKEALWRVVGERAFGYRSPSWEMTRETFDVLIRHGVSYDSSMMGYDHPYWVGDLPEIPVQWTLDDAPFFRYTGFGGDSAPRDPTEVMGMWGQEFEGAKRYGGIFMVTMHPWMSGRAGRIMALEELIARLKSDPDAWWATCEEVAEHHRSAYPDMFRVSPMPETEA